MGSRELIKELYSMDEICRTCTMNNEKNFLIPILKHNSKLDVQPCELIKYFFNFLEIEIAENDFLPQNICKDCYIKFVDVKSFLDKCIEANNFLCDCINKSKHHDEKYLVQRNKINEIDETGTIIEKINNQENEFLNSTIENQSISLINAKKDNIHTVPVVKEHNYQEIELDIIEEDNDNVEILDDYESGNIMKVDYVSESELQVIDNENVALVDCPYCNFAFSEDFYKEHVNDYHPEESPYLCTKCFRNFRTQNIRDKHIFLNMCQINDHKMQEFQHNAVEVFVADDDYYNSKEIVSDDDFIEKIQIKQEKIYNENIDLFTSKKDQICNNENKKNENSSSENLSLKCQICSEVFTRSKFFSEHIKRSHPDFDKKLIRSKYACQICDKDCKTKQSLESHLNSHRGVKPFVCEICKAGFYGSKALRTHINNEHSSAQFGCQLCGKEFIKKGVFLTHMSNHKKDNDPNRKPDIKYKCQFCPRTFNTLSTLTIHALTHKKLLESKHICNVCGVTFKRADHLKMHMYGVHLDHKPFPCDQCDKSFPTAWQRNTHVKKYHSAEKKKYKCEICSNEYASSNALKRHNMVHTGELKYSCDVCDQKFFKISLLEEHLKTHEIDENQRQESINEVYMEIAKSVIIPN